MVLVGRNEVEISSSRPKVAQACGARACQVCFGLAQFRGWGSSGLLQFQTLFSNFNLHIRGAQGIPLSTYPAMRKRENAAKIAAISLSQPKFTQNLNFLLILWELCTANEITFLLKAYLWNWFSFIFYSQVSCFVGLYWWKINMDVSVHWFWATPPNKQ